MADVAGADADKQRGNAAYASGDYDQAISAYTAAIIKNPTSAILFQNRALCFLKTYKLNRCIDDCEKAVSLDPHSVKGHYFMGQALMEDSQRVSEACGVLKKAYMLAIEQKAVFAEDVANAFRRSKAKRWERDDARRREEQSELYSYLKNLVERDRRRQLEQLDPDDGVSRSEVDQAQDERMSQIVALFDTAQQEAKRREVPEAFLGKINFELMIDPVIGPSGITYDRTEILHHIRKIGPWDPLARTPLYEKDLIPNLALKETIEAFLEKNGWAADY